MKVRTVTDGETRGGREEERSRSCEKKHHRKRTSLGAGGTSGTGRAGAWSMLTGNRREGRTPRDKKSRFKREVGGDPGTMTRNGTEGGVENWR